MATFKVRTNRAHVHRSIADIWLPKCRCLAGQQWYAGKASSMALVAHIRSPRGTVVGDNGAIGGAQHAIPPNTHQCQGRGGDSPTGFSFQQIARFTRSRV